MPCSIVSKVVEEDSTLVIEVEHRNVPERMRKTFFFLLLGARGGGGGGGGSSSKSLVASEDMLVACLFDHFRLLQLVGIRV